MRKLNVTDVYELRVANSDFATGTAYVLASNDESCIVLDSANKLFKVHTEQDEIESVVAMTSSVAQDIDDGAYTAE